MFTKRQIGRLGENIAKNYLIQKGYQFILANYKIPQGEIDLIFQKNNVVIFVEVKTRTNQSFGFPEEAVDENKLERIMQAIWHFLDIHQVNQEWQIDLISVTLDVKSGLAKINHLSNVNLDY